MGLAERCNGELFSGPDFQWAHWKAFCSGRQMLIVTARERTGRLAGLLPVMVHTPTFHGARVRELAFPRSHHMLRNEILIDAPRHPSAAILSAMIGALERECQWESFYFDNMPERQWAFVAEAVEKTGLLTSGWEVGRVLRYAVLPSHWDAYVAGWSGNFRRQHRKWRRLADQLGSVKIRRLETRADILSGLAELFQVESQSWQGATKDAALTDPDRIFMTSLAETLPKRCLGELWLLALESRPIAALRMLGSDRLRYVHTMYFDRSFRDIAPGALLFEQMMHHAVDAGLQEVDFNGDSRFFQRWSTGSRTRGILRAFQPSLRGRLLYTGRQMIRAWRLGSGRASRRRNALRSGQQASSDPRSEHEENSSWALARPSDL
jgi:CelD/BcsL family acetyltransferase involved in cellulose biosynthesis